jgi:hypothetical protein
MFRKDGIQVDIAPPGQRVVARFPHEEALQFRLLLLRAELTPEGGIGLGKALDEPLAGGRIGRAGDLGVSYGEELVLLELDALPGRVHDHGVEAPAPLLEHVRELQFPVEKAFLIPQFPNGARPVLQPLRGHDEALAPREVPQQFGIRESQGQVGRHLTPSALSRGIPLS